MFRESNIGTWVSLNLKTFLFGWDITQIHVQNLSHVYILLGYCTWIVDPNHAHCHKVNFLLKFSVCGGPKSLT